ncbi:VWA domain-containing protein [Aquabacterium sp. OR-4]|uniref:VWA domain-containing protein n=1 Tax=Aquabacterium sp. OR-4 TaxID=2978127 RepID=UPI0028CACAE0|nr:VWA domain-containing protein [Aquabacterium sp. OR-4]MDT7837885.1 VWA domain-containing protein [Aquabacterium sp. OR-4]
MGLAAWVLAALTACGGGGGGSPDSPSQTGSGGMAALPGVLQVRVTDAQGTPVPGVQVKASAGGYTDVSGSTDSQGLALIAVPWRDTPATVTVSGSAVQTQVLPTPWKASQINDLAVTLTRLTQPAAGVLASRSGLAAVVGDAGRSLSFEVEVVVVDAQGDSLSDLTAERFSLLACTPDASTGSQDCLRGAGSDTAYAAAAPDALSTVAGQAAQPHAAALLMDQSSSILGSDPTGARLYSAKSFFAALGGQDQVRLAAFAAGSGTLLPTQPLTVYPGRVTAAEPRALHATLDGLSAQVGGQTPLYAAIDALRAQMLLDTAVPAGMARSIIAFTDGADTQCRSSTECATMRQATIAAAQASQVRLFTIGLSKNVDVEALSSLAVQTGGAMLYAETAEQLIPLYGSLGRLLSLSLPTYRLRFTAQAGTAGAFAPGQVLMGTLQIDARGQPVRVPFVVSVP